MAGLAMIANGKGKLVASIQPRSLTVKRGVGPGFLAGQELVVGTSRFAPGFDLQTHISLHTS